MHKYYHFFSQQYYSTVLYSTVPYSTIHGIYFFSDFHKKKMNVSIINSILLLYSGMMCFASEYVNEWCANNWKYVILYYFTLVIVITFTLIIIIICYYYD